MDRSKENQGNGDKALGTPNAQKVFEKVLERSLRDEFKPVFAEAEPEIGSSI